VFRGREYDVDLLPKIKIELVLSDDTVESAIEAISNAAYTGKIGDGKIFTYNVGGAIRIRSKERDHAAI
jgi:nitrogen regulatory protein PII